MKELLLIESNHGLQPTCIAAVVVAARKAEVTSETGHRVAVVTAERPIQ